MDAQADSTGMNADHDDPPPIWWKTPHTLRNFRQIGPLTDEAVEWWREFGAKLEAAQREWDGRK